MSVFDLIKIIVFIPIYILALNKIVYNIEVYCIDKESWKVTKYTLLALALFWPVTLIWLELITWRNLMKY